MKHTCLEVYEFFFELYKTHLKLSLQSVCVLDKGLSGQFKAFVLPSV